MSLKPPPVARQIVVFVIQLFHIGNERAEPTFSSLFDFLWCRRKSILCVGLAAGLLGFFVAFVQTPRYVASLEIVPNVEDKASLSSILDPAGGGAFTSLLSGSPFGKSERVTPFQQFILLLFSPEVADAVQKRDHILQQLYPDRWDEERHQWKEGPLTPLTALQRFLNLPVPSYPDAHVLADYLERHIAVTEDKITAMVTLSYAYKDQQMAKKLLGDLYTATEEAILQRQSKLDSARLFQAEHNLPDQTLETNRQALTSVLTYYNLRSIETKAGSPYAAIKLSGPDSLPYPTDPNFLIYIAAAFGLGAISMVIYLMFGSLQK